MTINHTATFYSNLNYSNKKRNDTSTINKIKFGVTFHLINYGTFIHCLMIKKKQTTIASLYGISSFNQVLYATTHTESDACGHIHSLYQ